MQPGGSGIWLGRRGAIQRQLQFGCKSVQRGAIRPRHPGWRHHSGADLSNHFFPSLRVVAGMREIQFVDRETGRASLFVMAADAISIEQRAVLSAGPSAAETDQECEQRLHCDVNF